MRDETVSEIEVMKLLVFCFLGNKDYWNLHLKEPSERLCVRRPERKLTPKPSSEVSFAKEQAWQTFFNRPGRVTAHSSYYSLALIPTPKLLVDSHMINIHPCLSVNKYVCNHFSIMGKTSSLELPTLFVPEVH